MCSLGPVPFVRFYHPHCIMSATPSVGIRREGKSRWERRSPLAPAHVKALVAQGIKVLVQPSTIRVYHDSKYIEVRSRPF